MCLAAYGNLTSIELAVREDSAAEVVMTWPIMIWERAGGLGRDVREQRETLKPKPSGWGQSQMFFLRELQKAKPLNLL
jgi:hypothetical protein